MAKTNITQYSATPSSNTDINSINIDENCPASGLNNAIRELMAHLKNVDTGSQALTALSVTGAITGTTATLTTADNNPQLTLTSTDADANAGAEAVLDRNSSSPADDDRIGKLTFKGRNDANQVVEYGNIQQRITDASDGTEDGRIIIQNIMAGDVAGVMESNGTETVFNNNSKDLDFRVESDGHAHAFFLQASDGIIKMKTTNDDTCFNNQTGVSIGSNNGSALAGVGQFSCNGGVALRVNRTNEKGASIGIHGEGTQRATIGTVSTADVYFGCDRGAGLRISDQELIPCNATGAFNNDAVDLGHPSSFFDDIRATNGTIQTSDQQEKNTIEDSDLGLDFVKRLSPKSYIFNGKTRTHYGLIAQDVETVLSDINKPTSDFAGFIKDDVSEEQDGSSYRYGLRYTEFVAPLIKAIKEQQTIIEDLQARITALENA